MSTLLWKYYFENDVDRFRQVLARATYNATAHQTRVSGTGKAGNIGIGGSPGAALATSPTLSKSVKQSSWNPQRAHSHNKTPKSLANVTLGRADINWRDSYGVTLLHHIASSAHKNASDFAIALLQLPLLDLYVQDEESGWTALHRALYFGNITTARALMDRDIQDAVEHSNLGASHNAGGLIKMKDREGNSPFDVYGASITCRTIRQGPIIPMLAGSLDDEDTDMAQGISGDLNDKIGSSRLVVPRTRIDGDELFAFGSNKNFTLGFGDEDDRQFPERIVLRRPDHLLNRFQMEYEAQILQPTNSQYLEGRTSPLRPSQQPAVVQHRPIIIQDVQLSKLHSAVLTTDPEANLYICGFGSGGRLGTGDETTRFGFVNVHGGGLLGKKIIHVGLGQNHTIAISSEGETFTWGSNGYGQLGYTINPSAKTDKEPVQLLPRQVFGPLKRELIVGAAASRIHSVVHTATSLYTFGKNEGQLGLFDSDARSLAVQNIPRKVAASLFSSSIRAVSAIDKATICLLENHDVWVFSLFGYQKVAFQLEGFSNYFLKSAWGARSSTAENYVCKITSGGDTICAMSSMGDVFTMHVSQKSEALIPTASTTNPTKIRGALSSPQRVWSLKKSHMAVRDVDVSQDGSIIICTESGSVWKRVKRAKIKDAAAAAPAEYKAKDYKFSRVPGLTRITAVRSNTFGAYAAVRRDCDVLKTQVDVGSSTLWKDLYPLLPFHGFGEEHSDTENPEPRFWKPSQPNDVATIRRAVLTFSDIEDTLASFLGDQSSKPRTYNARIGSTISDVRIPVHDFVLAARSESMRQGLSVFRRAYFFSIPEVVTIEYDGEGKTLILFQGIDFLTVFNLVLYLYTDSVVDVWHHTRHAPASAYRYRQVRTELMKLASHLEMRKLEQAVRMMTEPPKTLHNDFDLAARQPGFFENGDVEVHLEGKSMKVHCALMCQRCPFFEGLFQGRAAGLWLSSRREQIKDPEEAIRVDLKHVDPHIFEFVLRHIYADSDEEMFDGVVATGMDAFLDLIMDVLSVANELMLDRLAQCCQKMLGRYVNTRNVCQLLNAVAPCSVTQFKDAALEYICLNLESMLENHLLNELNDDLMLELDDIVRQNQLASLPFAKSGRAEAELAERYPQLIESIARSKRIKVDSVSLQTRFHEREAKSVGGSKAKAAFFEDFEASPSASVNKPQRIPSRERTSQSKSPSLRAKNSTADLMFAMDEDSGLEEETNDMYTPTRHRRANPRAVDPLLPPSRLPIEDHFGGRLKGASAGVDDNIGESTSPLSFKSPGFTVSHPRRPAETSDSKQPWGSLAMGASKLDMKDIMAQASPRISNLSVGLAGPTRNNEAATTSIPAKLSQRERKKQQQLRSPLAVETQSPAIEDEHLPDRKLASPWQVTSVGPKISLKDVLGTERNESSSSQTGSTARTPSPLNLRQTVSGKVPTTRRTTSGPPQTLAPTQKRSISTPDTSKAALLTSPSSSSSKQPILSIRHTITPVEPSLQLSMADILSQQQTEKDIIKEAAAKRSLQEIQEEQAFQEWWDEESRKVKAEEEAAKPAARGGREARGKMRGGSRGRGRGRGEGGEGRRSGAARGGRKAGSGGKEEVKRK